MVSEVFRFRADFDESHAENMFLQREALVVSPRGQKLVKVAWHPMSDVTWMAKFGQVTMDFTFKVGFVDHVLSCFIVFYYPK